MNAAEKVKNTPYSHFIWIWSSSHSVVLLFSEGIFSSSLLLCTLLCFLQLSLNMTQQNECFRCTLLNDQSCGVTMKSRWDYRDRKGAAVDNAITFSVWLLLCKKKNNDFSCFSINHKIVLIESHVSQWKVFALRQGGGFLAFKIVIFCKTANETADKSRNHRLDVTTARNDKRWQQEVVGALFIYLFLENVWSMWTSNNIAHFIKGCVVCTCWIHSSSIKLSTTF